MKTNKKKPKETEKCSLHTVETGTIASNTFFQKPNQKLITYRAPTNEPLGPPWTRGKYETLDYTLTPERWKNATIDAESDVKAHISTDRCPIIANSSKFKKMCKKK